MQLSETFLVLMVLAISSAALAAQSPAQPVDGGCWHIASQFPHTASNFGHGLATAPREAIRSTNLKWELPIAAATGLLVATADNHINDHIQSHSFAQAAARGSDIGLGIEVGTAGLMYLVGCTGHRSSYAANTGFTALEAVGAANVLD